MDAIEAIKKGLATYLGADAALKALFPGGAVVLFWEWADQDRESADDVAAEGKFPYIVCALAVAGVADELWCLKEGALTVDVWDQGSTSDRLSAIAARVRALLVMYSLDTAGGEARAVTFTRPDLDQDIPDDEPDVWRREIVFPFVFLDAAEVSAVTSR